MPYHVWILVEVFLQGSVSRSNRCLGFQEYTDRGAKDKDKEIILNVNEISEDKDTNIVSTKVSFFFTCHSYLILPGQSEILQ